MDKNYTIEVLYTDGSDVGPCRREVTVTAGDVAEAILAAEQKVLDDLPKLSISILDSECIRENGELAAAMTCNGCDKLYIIGRSDAHDFENFCSGICEAEHMILKAELAGA